MPKTQDPRPKTQDPRPKTQDPRPKTTPTPKITHAQDHQPLGPLPRSLPRPSAFFSKIIFLCKVYQFSMGGGLMQLVA